MTAPSYNITNESVTVILDGRTHTVRKDEANFQDIVNAIMSAAWDDLPPMLVKGIAMEEWLKGLNFTYKPERHALFFKGEQLPEALNRRIVATADEGNDPTPLMRFWEKLQQNPSFRSVNQLWGFLDQKGIPLDEDGNILAYKAVKRDYTDCHSGTFDNSPGSVNEMPRNKISDDPQVACHEGFHVGALSYAKSFGPTDKRMIICKVSPADVVCVPYDSSQQKMRVCKYEVIGNHGSEMPSTVMPKADIPPMPKKGASKPKAPASTAKETQDWVRLIDTPDDKLAEATTADLRKYAAHHLKIVGACKIPGGKEVLIERILDVRREG